MSETASDGPPTLKDPNGEHPIPGPWRPTLREVVRCLAEGDYQLSQGVPGVEPVSASTAEQIRSFVTDYGTTLVELPDATWETSVARWMETHWEILVDLWTAEEGRSDMVA